MKCKNEHFRHIFHFYFCKGKNAAQAAKKLRDVYGEEALKNIKAIIESVRHVSVREIEEMLKIPKSTINRHIQRLGLVKKLDIWIPHELKEIH